MDWVEEEEGSGKTPKDSQTEGKALESANEKRKQFVITHYSS